jgi:transcriptional repressor NrdR
MDEDRVVDTRPRNAGKSIRRKRLCLHCGKRFYTIETIEDKTPTVVKRDGRREPYDRRKLLRSIQIACTKRPVPLEDIERIADEIESDMDFGYEISSGVIGEKTIEALRRLDDVAYVRFASVYRNFRDKEEFLRELHQLDQVDPPDGRPV